MAALFAADVAGYSRLMGRDEAATLVALAAARAVMDGLIAESTVEAARALRSSASR